MRSSRNSWSFEKNNRKLIKNRTEYLNYYYEEMRSIDRDIEEASKEPINDQAESIQMTA